MRGFAELAATLRGPRASERPPRPLLSALPQISIALLVLVTGFALGIGWPWTISTACSLVLVGLLQAVRATVELDRRRRTADDWLLWGAAARPTSALLNWRAEELSSPRLRATLAKGLRRIELETRGGTLPGPVPLNRRAVRSQRMLLHALQRHLEDQARPVFVRGMVLVERLLTEPGSPLYSYVPDEVLAQALSEILAALASAPAAAAAA